MVHGLLKTCMAQNNAKKLFHLYVAEGGKENDGESPLTHVS